MLVGTAVFLFYKVSLTSEKIINDGFAGTTFPQEQSQALSGKLLRLEVRSIQKRLEEDTFVPRKVCRITFQRIFQKGEKQSLILLFHN